MKVTTKISVSFDTENIGMDITDWTKEDLESYYVETFVEDIYSAIKYDDFKDMVRVEITEKGLGR